MKKNLKNTAHRNAIHNT